MGAYEIRAVTKLVLDDEKEKDIIKEINSLVEHRKFGNYITNLLRFAADHREDLEDLGFDGESRGKTDTRKQMYREFNDQIVELKNKVDAVFDMALAMKAAMEVGKVTALESQVDNVVAAQVVLRTQLSKLRRSIGLEFEYVFDGDNGIVKKESIDKAAKDAADLALQHYGEQLYELANMFSNLKNEISSSTVAVQPVVVNTNPQVVQNDSTVNEDNKAEEVAEAPEKVEENAEGSGFTPLSNINDLKFDENADALSDFFNI